MVMLSAVDGPPGPSVVSVHGPGGPSMAAALGPGTDCGGTIGSVIGSRGKCLDCTLLWVQVIAGLGFFLHSSHLVYSEGSDSLLYRVQPS